MKILAGATGWILRRYREKIDSYIYKDYEDNPFHVCDNAIDVQKYLNLGAFAKENIDADFLDEIAKIFGYLLDDEFINELALATQVVIKKSQPLYLHGYLLYGAVRQYCEKYEDVRSLNILETGTARGFSALIMAKALFDSRKPGKILTVDILPPAKPIYWNCIHDRDGKKTRLQLLSKWRYLVDEYIIFSQGYSDTLLNRLEFPRIHFAFLDGGHNYETVKRELSYVETHQKKGDTIVCDDYTITQFPGLVKALDEFLSEGHYTSKVFRSSADRAYVWLSRK